MADKDNLVSFWKMDEASGSLLDAFASNDLTQNGTVASASGKINTGRGPFSASNYFSSTSSNLQKGSGDFTFACWAVNATSSFPVIVSKGWPGGEYVIYANGGDVIFAIGPSGSVVQSGIVSGWNFIVAVYDSTVPRLRLSLNGGTFVNATVSPINASGSDPFVIGCSPAQSIFWNAAIDEFAFWKRALSQSDVTRFYNSGSGLPFADWTGGATGVTATLAATDGADSLTATATASVSASFARTDGSDPLSASSAVALAASLTRTDGSDSLSASGIVAARSTLTATDGSDTLSASAAVQASASLARTDGNDTLSTSATVSISASVNATDGADSLVFTAVGSAQSTATLTATDGADLLSASATVSVSSTLAATDGSDSISAIGTIRIAASLTITDGADLATITATSGGTVSIGQYLGPVVCHSQTVVCYPNTVRAW